MSNITKLPAKAQSKSGIDALLADAKGYLDREIRGYYEKAFSLDVPEPAALIQAALETLHALRLSGIREIRIHGDNDDLSPHWLYDMMAVIPYGTLPVGDNATRFDLVIKISRQNKKIHAAAVQIVPPTCSAQLAFELSRMVQANGHDIFQFTEAEVLADPWGCAAQISDWSDALEYEG